MTSYVETNTRQFPTGGTAIGQHIRVKLSAGVLAVAGIADEDIGTIVQDVFTTDVEAAVRLKSANGTRKMVAASAFSAGAVLYAAASGKVDDAITAQRIGIALEAATAGGDIIEVLTDYGSGAAYRVVGGTATLDGSNPTPVTTGLTTAVAGVAVIEGSTAPGDDPVTLTTEVSTGTLNVYAWKHNGTDPTLVASTDNARVFHWIAIGY
jgi:hypothetical protein